MAVAVRADVSDASAVRAMFDAAQERFGGIDVLVNNAGIMQLAPIAQSADEFFDHRIAINLDMDENALRPAACKCRIEECQAGAAAGDPNIHTSSVTNTSSSK